MCCLLTETPLQNNLDELFNLMRFLTSDSNPDQRFPTMEVSVLLICC
jgi:SNF2 family DNA or RNA helicase